MDFKTTGTKNGLTATQMDIKCDGLSYEILEKALMQAKASREHIMGEMMKTISEPRPELKPHVPRIEQIIIPKEFIGAVIGPGGKVIQQMQEDTQTTITIEEEDGVGKVQISAPDKTAIEAAYQEGQAKLKGNGRPVPPLAAIKNPLRDGDIERPDDPAYANAYFVNANSATAPGIVDADRNEIITRSEVYSGVYGRASINFYAFNSNGNRGIACGLNNLQKFRDGEPLGGKASASSDFDTDDNDDFLA
jgi:hypothetical protein